MYLWKDKCIPDWLYYILPFSAIKTDLSLLLECLKFQMKCPDLQKQALLTIHSIFEKRGNNEQSMT